jgi:hypothetical protein
MSRTKQRILLYSSAGILVIVLVGSRFMIESHAQRNRFKVDVTPVDRNDYNPTKVVPAFPPIVNPPAVVASEAEELLAPNELVLGVTVNGESRAYAINMLTGPSREIFNDQLGGQSIAATW